MAILATCALLATKRYAYAMAWKHNKTFRTTQRYAPDPPNSQPALALAK